MNDSALTDEIERLVSLGIAEKENVTIRLRTCSAVDNKRGGLCYPAALAKINTAMGYRVTGPNEFDVGSIGG